MNEKITDIAREGYTVKGLIKDYSMNPIAAYLTLDYLEKQPDEAKKSLKKGHDIVEV